MSKILHITNWYPNLWNKLEAQFIRELFTALPDYIDGELWHIQVRHESAFFKIVTGSISQREHYLIVDTRIKVWKVIELVTLALLVILRIKLRKNRCDITNIHIAYPLARFPSALFRLFGRSIIISEHWSAYRNGFGLKPGSSARTRIQGIFRHGIPVVAVSRALSDEIYHFSDEAKYPRYVVPNVVDPKIFYFDPSIDREDPPRFLMVANWAPIKKPLLLLRVMKELRKKHDFSLRIIGYGAQWEGMREFAEQNDLLETAHFLGPRSKREIAAEMRRATALLHSSDYETFSVVCAEAISCGTPVIASNVGGIPEFVHSCNGFLVANTDSEWLSALETFINQGVRWSPEEIAREAQSKFSPKAVGEKMAAIYKDYMAYKARNR